MIRARSGQNCQFDDWAYSEVIYRSSDQDTAGGDRGGVKWERRKKVGSSLFNVDDEVAYIGVNLKPSASHADANGCFLCGGCEYIYLFDTLEIRLQYMYLMHYFALNT